MMNKSVSLGIFILLSLAVLSQDKKIDSLIQLVKTEKIDSARVKLMLEIAKGYSLKKRDSALWYYQHAKDLSREINYSEGEIDANDQIADLFTRSGNYPDALRLLLQNLKTHEESQSVVDIFITKRNLLWIYRDIGDSLKMLQILKELDSLADSQLSKNEKRGKSLKFMVYHNMSAFFRNKGKYDSAFKYEGLAYNYATEAGQMEGLALTTNTLADFYSNTGRADSGFYYYTKALFYAGKASRFDILRKAKGGLASLFEKKGKLDSALFYGYQYYNECKNVPDTAGMMNAVLQLSAFYKQQKQFDSAYKYLSDYTFLQEKSLNGEKIERTQNISFNETLHQQQLQQERKLAQQQYQSQVKIFGLIGGMAILAVLALILHRNNKQKLKTNTLLQIQKEEIQNTLSELRSTQAQLIQSEKMASLGELTAGIAHEIQNPLNFINNFSEVSRELIEEWKEELEKGNGHQALPVAENIMHNLEKINHHGKRADAIVKGMLQHSRSSSGQKELTAVNVLADEYLRLAYHGLRAKDKSFNAKFETNFDPSIEKVNVVPQDVGRVILNLISNAFYAVNEKKKQQPESYKPTVSVSTKKVNGEVEIKVTDNGIGIPQKALDKIFHPFFTTKPTGQGTGLGLSLSYDIVKAHGGKLNVKTKEGEGSEFIIQLPIV